jgi:Holliday junction resolvasome RuvABC endonuclease subunit
MKKPSRWIAIGVDPGSYNTGWCIVEITNRNKSINLIDIGTISTKDKNQLTRITDINSQFGKLLKRYIYGRENALIVAEAYFPKMFKGADLPLKILGAIISATNSVPKKHLYYIEVNRKSVGKAITGYGGERGKTISKEVLHKLLRKTIKFPASIDKDKLDEHAMDALACCITGISKFDFVKKTKKESK